MEQSRELREQEWDLHDDKTNVPLEFTEENKPALFEIDEQSNFIRVAEKSPKFVSDLANVGIYYFPNQVKGLISKERLELSKEEETITDLFNIYVQKYPIKILASNDYNIEISTVNDLEIGL